MLRMYEFAHFHVMVIRDCGQEQIRRWRASTGIYRLHQKLSDWVPKYHRPGLVRRDPNSANPEHPVVGAPCGRLTAIQPCIFYNFRQAYKTQARAEGRCGLGWLYSSWPMLFLQDHL